MPGPPRRRLPARALDISWQALIPHERSTWNTAIADSPSPQIADSNDGCAVDGGADKRLSPFVFDIFAEGDDRLVNDVQPSAKRRFLVSTH